MLISKKSYSLDSILLVNEDGGRYIIKTWNDHEKGKKSIEKQVDFNTLNIGKCTVKAPKVFSTHSLDNGRFQAKMAYIEGECGVDLINRSSRQLVIKIREVLGTILLFNLEDSNVVDVPANKFINKLISVRSNTKSLILLDLINTLIGSFQNYRTIELPIGNSHGDLTLSNLILSDSDSIYLIDRNRNKLDFSFFKS